MNTMPLIASLLLSMLFSYNAHAENFNLTQEVGYQRDEAAQANLTNLYAPITLTREGIDDFVRSIYNNPHYAREVLPNNFSHLIQFLEHGATTKQSRAYAQSTLRLFYDKLKACSYVNASAFDELLEQLPTLLQPYVTTTRTYAIDRLQKRINTVLYSQFLEKFGVFKNDPHAFFGNLSHIIIEEIEAEHAADTSLVSSEEMRKTILIFLEVGLGKLMWSPHSKNNSWGTVKSISEHLTNLLENSILADPDDLNDLFITLTERYCYFLDIAATDLPLSFYHAVTQEITSTPLPLLVLEEQEEHIEPKARRLLRALTHAEARCRAYNHGAIKPQTTA